MLSGWHNHLTLQCVGEGVVMNVRRNCSVMKMAMLALVWDVIIV